MAGAGVVYDVAVRPVDENNMALNAPAAPPVVTQYFVEDGNVRIVGANARMVYLFKDRTMYVVDSRARMVHVLRHATLHDLTAHYADAVQQLEAAADAAAPEQREAARQKAADMKALSDRLRETVPREFRLTARFESVDGRACRIWEEREDGAKRLELCVAPLTAVPGGAEILSGMKSLSQFRQGSDFALGVELGLSDWWPDIAALSGVPMLIREYKYDSVVYEIMLSGMRTGVSSAGKWDLPQGYAREDGPDFTLWYAR